MQLSNVTGGYYQNDTKDLPRSISWQQLFVLYVAANYNLRRSSSGWWADGNVFRDGVVRIHSPATIKSLLKLGLLEGNVGGEALGSGKPGRIVEPPIAMLWISAKGKQLLDKITNETGLAFDKQNYEIVEPGTDQAADAIELGHFATERETALAYDRAAILLYGDKAETNFLPEESEPVILSEKVMRQINELKEGLGRLQ
jgi:hypothetical protein